jgi:hypothetical protein
MMSFVARAVLAAAVVFITAFTTGCGWLVSSDIASVSFNLPAKTYVFDTAAWATPPIQQIPTVPCTTGEECCTLAGMLGYSCTTQPPLVCDGGTCAARMEVETPPQMIDLGREAPELSSLSGQTVANISISRINFVVMNNTLNVDLPPVSLYLAPQGVTSTKDPQVKKFGTVPSIAAGTSPATDVMLEPNAESTFNSFARNFATPFTFLSSATVTLRSGQPVPQGRIEITVQGRLSARPNL